MRAGGIEARTLRGILRTRHRRTSDDARVDEAHASEDVLNLTCGRRCDGVAFDEYRLRVRKEQGIANPLRDLDGDAGRNNRHHELGLAHEAVVVVDDLEAGAL